MKDSAVPLIIIIVLLLLFFSAYVSRQDVQQMKDEWEEKYMLLESEYEEMKSQYEDKLDSLYISISKTEDYMYTLSDYFDEENDVTFSDAGAAYDSLRSILYSFY